MTNYCNSCGNYIGYDQSMRTCPNCGGAVNHDTETNQYGDQSSMNQYGDTTYQYGDVNEPPPTYGETQYGSAPPHGNDPMYASENLFGDGTVNQYGDVNVPPSTNVVPHQAQSGHTKGAPIIHDVATASSGDSATDLDQPVAASNRGDNDHESGSNPQLFGDADYVEGNEKERRANLQSALKKLQNAPLARISHGLFVLWVILTAFTIAYSIGVGVSIGVETAWVAWTIVALLAIDFVLSLVSFVFFFFYSYHVKRTKINLFDRMQLNKKRRDLNFNTKMVASTITPPLIGIFVIVVRYLEANIDGFILA